MSAPTRKARKPRENVYVRIMKAAETFSGLFLTAEEVYRLHNDEAIAEAARNRGYEDPQS